MDSLNLGTSDKDGEGSGAFRHNLVGRFSGDKDVRANIQVQFLAIAPHNLTLTSKGVQNGGRGIARLLKGGGNDHVDNLELVKLALVVLEAIRIHLFSQKALGRDDYLHHPSK